VKKVKDHQAVVVVVFVIVFCWESIDVARSVKGFPPGFPYSSARPSTIYQGARTNESHPTTPHPDAAERNNHKKTKQSTA